MQEDCRLRLLRQECQYRVSVVYLWLGIWCGLKIAIRLWRVRFWISRVSPQRLQWNDFRLWSDRLWQNSHDDGSTARPRAERHHSKLLRPHFRLHTKWLRQKVLGALFIPWNLQWGGVRLAAPCKSCPLKAWNQGEPRQRNLRERFAANYCALDSRDGILDDPRHK